MPTYRIIGADGREYGPISAPQLCEWIAEGRANATTRAKLEGTDLWKPLTEYVEFAAAISRTAPTPVSLAPIYYAPAPRTNSLATASLVMGLLAMTCGMCCCYGVPFNLLGIVFSLIALGQIRNDPQNQHGRALAIAGLVLSLLSLAMAALFLVFGLAVSASDIVHKLERI